jgi:uridine phosphorylase
MPVGLDKRYSCFIVGPVLIASHGMGGPSITSLLHEIGKLLKYSKSSATWIRLGTCGGIGLEPGTIVITDQSLNGSLEPYHTNIVLGRRVMRTAIFNEEVNNKLYAVCKNLGFKAARGKTMCADDFYEG